MRIRPVRIKLNILALALCVIALSVAITVSRTACNDVTRAVAEADTARSENSAENLPDSVDDLLDKLDISSIQGLLTMLGSDQLQAFGFSDIRERILMAANGNINGEFDNVFTYILTLLGANVLEFVPMIAGVLAIVLAYSIINSLKSGRLSEPIERVVYFSTGALALCLVVGYFSSAMVDAVRAVATVKTQINAVAPTLITLMTAAGATSTATIYTPSIAILGGGMTNIITYFAFPALLMGLVFDLIGSISSGIKLKNTADFLRSACKWFLGTAFFVFIAVIGVSGITASVRDGISVRAARFAVSKYVPVIGGYLSQGFDFIMAGNVLIKNAVGASAVVLIIITVAPVAVRLIIFTLALKLTAAIAEPLGGERFSSTLDSIAKSSSVITTIVIAAVVLYVLFLSMLICTGNIGL